MDDGMELRGTRPVKDDPDSFVQVVHDADYGFPDFSTDLFPISDSRFQPPERMAIKSPATTSSRFRSSSTASAPPE